MRQNYRCQTERCRHSFEQSVGHPNKTVICPACYGPTKRAPAPAAPPQPGSSK